MRAISIKHPWAWLIIHAGKDIENRSWYCRYRGPLLIHASKGCTRDEYEDCADFCAYRNLPEPPPYEQLKRGGVIGRVEVVDCVQWSESPWFVGKFGIVMKSPVPLPFAPCRGQLGIFDANYTEAGLDFMQPGPPPKQGRLF